MYCVLSYCYYVLRVTLLLLCIALLLRYCYYVLRVKLLLLCIAC